MQLAFTDFCHSFPQASATPIGVRSINHHTLKGFLYWQAETVTWEIKLKTGLLNSQGLSFNLAFFFSYHEDTDNAAFLKKRFGITN